MDITTLYRYMNVKELALWPHATRKRTDNEVDHVDVDSGFRQIA